MTEASEEYHFAAEDSPRYDGMICLRWSKRGPDQHYWDPLDFWIIEPDYVEQAKERVRSGELG